jgi:hypothetical protein
MTRDESDLNVSDAEGQEISAFEKEQREAGWAEHVTLTRATANWRELATGLNDYRHSIDDYTNDLYAREYLELALKRFAEPLRGRVRACVDASDHAFRSASEPDEEGFLGQFHRIDDLRSWWWHRIPASGPLSDYLRSTHG